MRRNIIAFSILMALAAGGCSKKPKTMQRPVPKVEAAEALKHTIPIYVDGVGNVRAFNSAILQAQVEGYLVDVQFEQGKLVRKGELLFTIDPSPYLAELADAEAQLLKDLAEVAFNKDKVERYTPLLADEYVSQLDYDKFVTDLEMSQAQVLKDEAMVELKKIDVDFCYIQAPFNGVAGKRLIDIGNLITNDGDKLLHVNQIQPIYIDFSVPERYAVSILEMQHKMAMPVHAQPTGCTEIFKGKVLVVGNEINKKTGMIPIRAQFENEEMLLWPGQFTKMHLVMGFINDAIMIPNSAVNVGQKGKYVLIVEQGNKVKMQSIETGILINGCYQITKGVEDGDVVITNGQLTTTPGKEVNVSTVDKKWIKILEHESF